MSFFGALRECLGMQGAPSWQQLLFVTVVAVTIGVAAYLVRLLMTRR